MLPMTSARVDSPPARAQWMWARRLGIPVALFITSRLLLIAFQALAISSGGKAAAVPWAEPWLRWDGMYYASVAENGYTFSTETYSSAPFFPLYPALIKLTSAVTGSTDSAALVVSNLALLGALIALCALAELEYGYQAAGTRAGVYLLLYPMALFFTAAYAESLFLLFTVSSAYFARKQRWTWAIVMGMLASVTRITGVLMIGVIALEWAASHGFTLSQINKRETWRALGRGLRVEGWVVLAALGIPLMLLSFMVYMNSNFGSLTAFADAHAAWRGPPDPLRFIREFVAVITGQTRLFHLVMAVVALIFVAVIIPLAFRLRGSYGWYLLLSALIPLASGLYSYMRVIGGLFPVFLVLGGVASRRIHPVLMGVLLLLQLLILWLFLHGGFVA